jgi:hypothetical protein
VIRVEAGEGLLEAASSARQIEWQLRGASPGNLSMRDLTPNGRCVESAAVRRDEINYPFRIIVRVH